RHRESRRSRRRRELEAHEVWRHPSDAADDPRRARTRDAGHARFDGRIESRALRGRAARTSRGPSRPRWPLAARRGSIRAGARRQGKDRALRSPRARRRAGDEESVSRKLVAYLIAVDAIALLLLALNWPHSLASNWPHFLGWTVISLLSELLWLKT